MKIAFVTPYFPPMVGGIETYSFELVKELAKENSIHVFTCGRGTTETFDGFIVSRLKALDVRNLPLRLGIPYPVPPSLMFRLVDFDADVIHAHGHAFLTSFFSAVAARLIHKPFILTIHDLGVAYHDYRAIRGVRPLFDSTFVDFTVKAASAVVALNKPTYDYISKFHPKRIELIPQGIDFEKFKPSENEDDGNYVTFIAARLTAQKGGESFIRSIPLVLSSEGDAKFQVIGDGIQKPYLQRLCKELHVEKHVEFVGRVKYAEVPKYLKQAKIVVFPSEIPTGLALLEVAATKKAIVTTANPWAIETLGDAPIFVKEKDPKEVAGAVACLLKDPAERSRIALRAWLKVSRAFSWKTVASQHAELYKNIVCA